MLDIIIFIGLQGAGKSTFYQIHFATTHKCVSKDMLRPSKTMNKATKQNLLVEEALRVGQSVVIDNTNSTKEDREPLIRLGHLYNASVIGYREGVKLLRFHPGDISPFLMRRDVSWVLCTKKVLKRCLCCATL